MRKIKEIINKGKNKNKKEKDQAYNEKMKKIREEKRIKKQRKNTIMLLTACVSCNFASLTFCFPLYR